MKDHLDVSIFKILTLLISLIIILLGFYLILKKKNSRSGEITLGNFSIKNSTAGIVFISLGIIALIVSIKKGFQRFSKDEIRVTKKKLDSNGNVTEIIESISISIDSAKMAPPFNEDIPVIEKK